jgi:hypothetical protein
VGGAGSPPQAGVHGWSLISSLRPQDPKAGSIYSPNQDLVGGASSQQPFLPVPLSYYLGSRSSG